jgi:hypothetical protein
VSALRLSSRKVSRWWSLPPIVVVLSFNIFLERKWPSIPGLLQFLILLAASAIAFGFTFGLARLICRFREPWDDP